MVGVREKPDWLELWSNSTTRYSQGMQKTILKHVSNCKADGLQQQKTSPAATPVNCEQDNEVTNDLMSVCSDIQMVGSEFRINYVRWIHAAMYQWFRGVLEA